MNTEHLTSIYEKFVQSKIQQKNVSKDPSFIQALILEDKKNHKEALDLYSSCNDDYPMNALLSLKIAAVLEKLNRKDESKDIIFHTIENKLISSYNAMNAFKVHPNLFLERHIMAEFIFKNKDLIKEEIQKRLSLKIINQYKAFVFWDNPETAPDIVKSTLKALKTHIDGKYEIIILSKENLEQYIKLPEHIKQLMAKNPTHFSDWLRTKLLRKYGGIWLDATCYLTQSLSKNINDIEKQDCFFFTYKGSRVGSWFISADPNSYVLNAVDIVMDIWWEKEAYLTNYFMYHDIVEMLYWVDEVYRNNWDRMLKIHPSKALEMNKNLQNEFNLNLYSQISQNFFVHKLTYKVNPTSYTKNTFIKKISDDTESVLLTLINIKSKLKNTIKFWIYQKNIYVFDLEVTNIKYAFDIYKKDELFCLDLVSRNENSLYKISLLNSKEKISLFQSKNLKELEEKILYINEYIINSLDIKYEYDISFILTSFNREKIIIKALESLKNQKISNVRYEVIIIDDYSKDNTVEVVKDYIKKYNLENFKLIQKLYNSGNPSIPRNDGIFLAKGKYVSFVDSDDYIDPDTATNAITMAKKNNSDIVFIRIGSTTGGRQGYGEIIFKSGNVDHANFQKHNLWATPQIFHIFNRDFLIQNRIFFNPSYKKWEDLVFISKAMSQTNKYSILADKVYYYLEDFQGDNLTFKDINIYEQCEIMIDALNSYAFQDDKEKYTAYMNRISSFIIQKLKSKVLKQNDKIFVLDLFRRNIDLKLIDFSSISHLPVIKQIIANDFNTAINSFN